MKNFELIRLDETDSTNRYVREAPFPAGVDFLAVTAEYQTAGRGQRGTHWESERGKNLTLSVLCRPEWLPTRQQFYISQAFALAGKEALDEYAEGITVKWPNDHYWQNCKLAGTLIEHNVAGSHLARTLIGIGINVNQRTFCGDAPNPVSLYQILGHEVDREALLQSLLTRFAEHYARLKAGEVDALQRDYFSALYRREGFHRYRDVCGEFSARIVSVAPDGPLTLCDDAGRERRYAFKEMEYVL